MFHGQSGNSLRQSAVFGGHRVSFVKAAILFE